jgi:hypothetical protein
MPCLLPDLQRRDARPSRARREACAQTMAGIALSDEPGLDHPIAKDQGHGFTGESTRGDTAVPIDGPENRTASTRAALSQISSALMGQ